MGLSLEQKAHIVVLHKEKYSNRVIAKRLGTNEWSVRNVLKNYRSEDSILRKKGSGRPKKTTERDERIIKRICLRNRFQHAGDINKTFEIQSGKKMSDRTVQRRLKNMKLEARRPAKKPLLVPRMKKQRLEWAKTYKNWTQNEWAQVIFSDESKFNLFGPDGNAVVRRRKGERYSDECVLPTVKHSPYVMVWGAITMFGVGHIILLEGSVNAKKYIGIIDEGVVPTLEQLSEHTKELIFQDDSAPCHRAKSVQNYKNSCGIISLPWPGNSPDLNPIENCWHYMSKNIRERRPKTVSELKLIIEEVWHNKIDLNYLQKLYESMPRRINEVIKKKGGCTNY